MGVRGLGDGARELLELKRREVRPVQSIDGGQVDRNRQQLAVDARLHAMLIGPPCREPAQVLVDLARIGVEDVWPVAVDQDAGAVVAVVRIAADVHALVDHQHFLVRPRRPDALPSRASKARADHQIIEHRHPSNMAHITPYADRVAPATTPDFRCLSIMAARSRSDIRLQMPSHDCVESSDCTRPSRSTVGSQRASRIPWTKRSGVSAMCARPMSPYVRTTSAMGVETTGLPAARYSGVFVGLMYWVAALSANGIIATSHPAM